MFVCKRRRKFRQPFRIFCTECHLFYRSVLEKDLKTERLFKKMWTWCSGNVQRSFDNIARICCQSQNSMHSNSRRDLTDVVSIVNCVPLHNGFLCVYNAVLIAVPELFRQKSGAIFAKRTKVIKKQLHFSADIQFLIKKSSVHVKYTFDNCAEHFALRV